MGNCLLQNAITAYSSDGEFAAFVRQRTGRAAKHTHVAMAGISRRVYAEMENWPSLIEQGSQPINLMTFRHVSRISLREGPQLSGVPRLGGPEARGPRVPPIKNKKSLRILSTIFSGGPFTFFIFLFLLFNLIVFYCPGRGLVSRPPPPLDTSLMTFNVEYLHCRL